jgi:hypothetical protein
MDRYLKPAAPVEQAALMMFRIGFAILFLIMPVAMLVSRRALFVLAPIGMIVIIIAALLLAAERAPSSFRLGPLEGLVSQGILFLLAWSALSLMWTPFVPQGAERLFRMASCALLVAIVLNLLPARMRSSNLYLIAIGVGLGVLALITTLVVKPKRVTPDTFERALVMISLLAWPAVTWLAIKRRSAMVMVLAAAIGGLALIWQGAILPALLAGAVVMGGALNNRQSTGAALTAGVCVLLLGAPVISLLIAILPTQGAGLGATLQSWADIILRDPVRLFTGHGIETSLRNKLSLVLDPAAPKSLLFEIWYELGLFGALALTATLVGAIRAILRLDPVLVPYLLGCFAFAFTLAATGLGTSQTWWLWSLATVVVCYAAVARGEIRVSRKMRLPQTRQASGE